MPIARAVQGGTHAENRGLSWWSILYGVGGAVVVDLLTYGIDPTVRNQNLERVVASDPAVAMVAVGSVAHDVKGELARAYVALRPGMTATEDDIVNHCRAHLAAYKLPRSVRFASDEPGESGHGLLMGGGAEQGGWGKVTAEGHAGEAVMPTSA